MHTRLFCLAMLAILHACSVKPGTFSSTSVPLPPDYAVPGNWAALPDKKDPADQVPDPAFQDLQAASRVDVFFLHPTTYFGKKDPWNASVEDATVNQNTDQTAILHQASIFNAAGRVFAPRYRQANYRSFFSDDKSSAQESWDLAYADIKSAFSYYLAHHNQGRPIIIAAHSQGAKHGIRLLKEFFDGKALQSQLVAAYLVGWTIEKGEFDNIPLCEKPEQTGCFCTWRTYRHGHLPESLPIGDQIAVSNPLTWDAALPSADKELNQGSVLKNYYKVFPGIAGALVHQGLVWVHKPKFPGSIFFTRKNYHIADLNLFWVSVRENAQLRAESFFRHSK